MRTSSFIKLDANAIGSTIRDQPALPPCTIDRVVIAETDRQFGDVLVEDFKHGLFELTSALEMPPFKLFEQILEGQESHLTLLPMLVEASRQSDPATSRHQSGRMRELARYASRRPAA